MFTYTTTMSAADSWTWSVQRAPFQRTPAEKIPVHWRFHAMLNREKGTILLDLTWPRQETGGPEGLGQERCEVPIDKLQQAANRYGSVHVVLDQLYLAIFEKHNIKPPAVPLRMVRGGTRARSVNNSGGGPIEFE